LTARELAGRIEVALSPELVQRAESLGHQIRTEDGAAKGAEVILNALYS
jgi:UDP:flavonoid glycosyltransferase YjiC (YdhE family)